MNVAEALGRRAATVCALCILACAANFSPAQADSFDTFVQVTCAPELGYFGIRRFGMSNMPYDVGRRVGASPNVMTNPYGIYTDIELKRSPLECELRSRTDNNEPKTVRLKVEGYFSDLNSQATSWAQIVDHVYISAEGKRIGQLFLNPHGFDAGIDLLEIWSEGAVLMMRTCTYYDHVNTPNKGCVAEQFPQPNPR
jgi:hypothetical protein